MTFAGVAIVVTAVLSLGIQNSDKLTALIAGGTTLTTSSGIGPEATPATNTTGAQVRDIKLSFVTANGKATGIGNEFKVLPNTAFNLQARANMSANELASSSCNLLTFTSTAPKTFPGTPTTTKLTFTTATRFATQAITGITAPTRYSVVCTSSISLKNGKTYTRQHTSNDLTVLISLPPVPGSGPKPPTPTPLPISISSPDGKRAYALGDIMTIAWTLTPANASGVTITLALCGTDKTCANAATTSLYYITNTKSFVYPTSATNGKGNFIWTVNDLSKSNIPLNGGSIAAYLKAGEFGRISVVEVGNTDSATNTAVSPIFSFK